MKPSRIATFASLLTVFAFTLFASPQHSPPAPSEANRSYKSVKKKTSTVSHASPASSSGAAAIAPSVGLTVEQVRVMDLLDRSPFIYPAPADALEGEEFIMKARRFVGFAPDRNNPLDMLRTLEDKIRSVGPVEAYVSSVPDGLRVQYHRLTDSTPVFDTTTNKPLTLDPPATYIFTCTGPNGTVQSQTKNCAGGCEVAFTF